MRFPRLAALLPALPAAILGLAPPAPAAGLPPSPAKPPNVLLLTLDTTRADALGVFGGKEARTPALDALAARGVRWTQAITPAPLTLPAHASLLTGLDPPEHGVQANGTDVLPRGVPTLAEAFSARSYVTAAFVASLVLDRRFGLARGFQLYDDKAPAEPANERRPAERDARQMTDAALEWLGRRPAGQSVFLWVHYYDPHEPYNPPDVDPKASDAQRYAGEVAAMDREIGRLLAALPGGAERWVIAAVGDHGESLGEHGEPHHGIFLYHSTLRVPLIVAGPGAPKGAAVTAAVSTRRLASTLLGLAGAGRTARSFGPPLPGLPGLDSGGASPVYAATRYPLAAYGWSPLEGVFDGRFKLIVAPRPELYDLATDPGETRNLLTDQQDQARRLKQALTAAQRAFKVHPAGAADPELARALESLGYLSGSGAGSGSRGKGTLDPKDGVPMLAELAAAWELARQESWPAAVAKLTDLVRRSPGNVLFLTTLGAAQLGNGEGDKAVDTYRRAIQENPRRDDSHRLLADAYARLGRPAEARKEYELALELNPRFFVAWWGLADLAEKEGRPARVRAVLTRAVKAGTESVSILKRLAELEAKAGDAAAAERHLAAARRLAQP